MFKSFRTKRTILKSTLPANLISRWRWFQPAFLRQPSRLGDELVINGQFETDTDWTKGTGWTLPGGAAVAAPGAISALAAIAPVSLVQGNPYWVVIWIGNPGGGGVASNIGTTLGTLFTTDGRHQEVVIAGASSLVALDKNAAFDAKVEFFSVKEIIF